MLAIINEKKSQDGNVNRYIFINTDHIADGYIERNGNLYFIVFKSIHGGILKSRNFNHYEDAFHSLVSLFNGKVISL